MDVTDLDRAQDFVHLNTNGAQLNGENLEVCYAAGRNDKPYGICYGLGITARKSVRTEGAIYEGGLWPYLFVITCEARPKNLQLLEEYQPFVVWTVGQ